MIQCIYCPRLAPRKPPAPRILKDPPSMAICWGKFMLRGAFDAAKCGSYRTFRKPPRKGVENIWLYCN